MKVESWARMKWVKNKARKEIFKEIQLDHEKTKKEIWKELKENSNAIKSPEHSAGSCNYIALGKDISLLQVPS